jgi:hypothetical protein
MNDVDKTKIINLNVWKNEKHVKVFGIYNPPQNNPALSLLDVSKRTLFVGDFIAHFHDVGYKNINEAGKGKILSWQIMLNYFMKRKISLHISITVDLPQIQISHWLLLILLHLLQETLLVIQDVDTG